MRALFLRLLIGFAALGLPLFGVAAPLPPELAAVLSAFRAEGAKGWSFVQTTTAAGEVRIERFDPAQPDFKRWTLLQQNGRPPSAGELRTYNETQTRRSSGFNAPRLQDQIDLVSGELLPSSPERPVWRFRLKQGGPDDATAEFMTATVTFDRATRAIEQVEMANTAPFSPAFGVKIEESKTLMIYSLPDGDRPSLLQKVTLRVQGRAFWVKSLNQEMTIVFSEHAWAGKKRL